MDHVGAEGVEDEEHLLGVSSICSNYLLVEQIQGLGILFKFRINTFNTNLYFCPTL